jgi:diguanylate cyclase (GGDEF)-like protein/hemerythrin-like metal-binding protein
MLLTVATALGMGLAAGYLLGRQRQRRKVAGLRRSLGAMKSANAGLQSVLESLEQAAGTDRLTGAWNRRRFEEAASAGMALARRRRETVSLLMLDLDHFKRINDSCGHEAGDAVLAGVVRAWKDVLRVSDTLSRWGGEEFIVLSPSTHLDGAILLGGKLQEVLQTLEFPGCGPVTVSIGAAEYTPGETLEGWVQRADQALYRAKANGRDRVVAAENPHPDRIVDKPILEIQWEEACCSGHPLIDTQHRRLFELANALLAAYTMGLPKEELVLRWNRLIAHTAQHFSDEERILAKAGFAELIHHAEEHQRLLRIAQEFQLQPREGALDLGRVVHFLAMDLVQGHLMQEDSTYFGELPFERPGFQP